MTNGDMGSYKIFPNKCVSPTEIKAELVATLVESAPLFFTVAVLMLDVPTGHENKLWIKLLKCFDWLPAEVRWLLQLLTVYQIIHINISEEWLTLFTR